MSHRLLAKFIGKRLLVALGLLVGITLVAFLLTRVVPANPLALAAGPRAGNDEAVRNALKHRYGMDRPAYQQYFSYLWGLVHGDLGTSIRTGDVVRTDLGQAIPATIELALVAIVLAALAGITFGTVSALYRERFPDQALRVLSLAGVSMPIFWLALVAFYFLSFRLEWFPGLGRLNPGVDPPPHVTGAYTIDALLAGEWAVLWDALYHLLLPALVLAAYTTSMLTRFTRAAVLDVINQDYVRTAYAKGLPRPLIVRRHVLRAASIPIVTVAGVMFGSVLTGTVLVETIFGYPGLGQYAYQSALSLDGPAIMGCTLFIAGVYIVINLVVDILYGVLDPRIRLG